MKAVLIGLVVLLVIAGGGYALLKNHKSTPKTSTVTATATPPPAPATIQSTPSTTPSTTMATATGSSDSFTITANDESASPETISVKQGDSIKLTFDVSSQDTYHGGLDFKSTDPAIDSGSIAEGSSKTITFTATKSFKFTPYWYESNVQKPYFVTVNVQ